MSITSTDVQELIAESTLESDAAMIDAISTRDGQDEAAAIELLDQIAAALSLPAAHESPA